MSLTQWEIEQNEREVKEGRHIHYWKLNDRNFGVCKKCEAKKQFPMPEYSIIKVSRRGPGARPKETPVEELKEGPIIGVIGGEE